MLTMEEETTGKTAISMTSCRMRAQVESGTTSRTRLRRFRSQVVASVVDSSTAIRELVEEAAHSVSLVTIRIGMLREVASMEVMDSCLRTKTRIQTKRILSQKENTSTKKTTTKTLTMTATTRTMKLWETGMGSLTWRIRGDAQENRH